MGINLSSLGNFLSPALTTATNAAATYQGTKASIAERERQEQLQMAIMQHSLERQAREDQVTNALKAAQTDQATARAKALGTPKPPSLDYDPLRGVVVNKTAGTASAPSGLPARPLDVGKSPAEIAGTPEATEWERKKAQIATQFGPTSQPTLSVQPGVEGQPAQGVVTHGRGIGTTMPLEDVQKTSGAAGGAAGARQVDYVGNMERGLAGMQQLEPKVRPAAVSSAIKYPNATNVFLRPEERQYVAHLRTFLSGVLHEESGARLTQTQLEQGIARYAPMVGDDPATRQMKLQAARDVAGARARTAGAHGAPSTATDPVLATYPWLKPPSED